MDGRGSCCIARHAAADYNPSKPAHGRIMLKFRPIAPKPAAGPAAVDGSGGHVTHQYYHDQTSTTSAAVMSTVGGRKRRRYRSRIKEQQKRDQEYSTPAPAVTLPLLPLAPVQVRMVGSIVTVESLTETWVVEYGLGYSDGERLGRLNDDDTCPGFVSDGFGRVVWTNGAYREMVRGGGSGGEDQDQVVSLMVKEEDQRVLMGCGAAFTCRVRVQYYGCRSMMIPCDAWRMDGGGFAWRLDMKAALRL